MTSSFFCWKAETISQNIPEDSRQIMMLEMTSCSDKKLRIVTKSRCGHPLINQPTNQQFQILAYKRRHLPCIEASWFSDQDHALAFSLCIAYVLLLLISSLCTSFPFLYLVNFFLIYVLILFVVTQFWIHQVFLKCYFISIIIYKNPKK